MYTSTPADLPDPPFRFFEGLVPRLDIHKGTRCGLALSESPLMSTKRIVLLKMTNNQEVSNMHFEEFA